MPMFVENLNVIDMKTIKEASDYQISEDGSVIVKRIVANGSERYPMVANGSDCYKYVTLINTKNGYYWRVSVHHLVALTYLPKSDKRYVRHIDGNKDNNHYTNLEWCDYADVNPDRVYASGEEHWNSGKEFSKEARKKMSKAKMGKKHPKCKGYYLVRDKKYWRTAEVAKLLGCSARSVLRWAKDPKNTIVQFVEKD